MKKILYVSLLSMVLFIGGCGKPSFQELQETYPKCTTTLTSILLSQKQCTAEKLLDETFDCGEWDFEEEFAFMRQECEQFIQKVNLRRMSKSCSFEKAKYTHEDNRKEIDCFLQYLGYPDEPEVPPQNATTFSSSPSNTPISPIPQTE